MHNKQIGTNRIKIKNLCLVFDFSYKKTNLSIRVTKIVRNLNWIDDVIKAICLLLVLVLSACGGSHPRVPVIERPQPKPLSAYRYVVNQGDTLYSIAWRYGLDFKQLASANAISPPYIIQPGQRIRLSVSGEQSSKLKQKSQVQASKTAATSSQKTYVKKPKPTVKAGSTNQKPASKPKKPVRQTVKKPSPPQRVAVASKLAKNIRWGWPINGKVIKTFSVNADKYMQGIDLSGRVGEPVKSAAAGVVVYTGDKLPGYGKLVIIKHNADFLSAYAYNRRIYVKEGQKVRLGERIADMGRSSTGGARLHFQIRQEGKPTNPLKLLPPKG